jgi:uncharacterized protein (DUF1778 family)
MSFKRSIKKIQELLDALSKAKTVQEKLKRLFMMKVHIELLEAPLKQQRDQKRMAYNRKTRIIKKALKQFVAALDKIYAKHEELGDTAVRDNMYGAILKSFIIPEKAYLLPVRFGMFCDDADRLVHAAIQQFLQHSEVVAARSLLKTPNERLNAFQDYDVKTSIGTKVCEYFGARGGPLA